MTPQSARAWTGACVALLALWQAGPAHAWERTQTCLPSGPYQCQPGQEPRGLFWPSSCVTYHIDQQGVTDLGKEASDQAIEQGFAAWNDPACSYLSLVLGGFTDERAVGYDQSRPDNNANVVYFVEEGWPYGAGILALTSVTYHPTSGVIYDADMELNAEDYLWSTQDSGQGARIDVANTVTHEAGHFLGLDHSGIADATMHASAPPGEISKRDLDNDDIAGLCDIYPTGSPVDDTCLGAPEGFYNTQRSQEDNMDQGTTPATKDESCACATPAAPTRAPLWPLGLALGAGLVWAVRRRPRRAALWLAPLACALGVSAVAPQAMAYQRTLTCQPGSTGPLACQPGETPKEIYWPATCVTYHVNQDGTQDTSNERAFVAIETSFMRWTAPDCSYMQFINGGLTDEDRVGYNSYTGSGQNANIIVFRDDTWEHETGVLALTSVTYKPSSGEIVDADIELNAVDYNFTTTNTPERVIIDVANTVTHEAGHFLGLDHSSVRDATMFATAPVRETKKRTLDRDDIEGLCAIYPAALAPNNKSCLGAPVGFFTRPLYGPGDGAPPAEARRCTCATPNRPMPYSGGLLLLALGGALLWLRRRAS